MKELTDPKNGKTAIEYDGGGRPTKVTDPRSLVTQYPRNGFGDATQLISPDTGTTNITYDAARRLKTRTDSRGVTETYTYDLEGRLTSVVYTQSGQASQTTTWSWDLTGPDYSYSIGHVSRVDHPSGFARFKYDPRGRITETVQSVNAKAGANTVPILTTVKYGYTLGRLSSITYPSGRQLSMTRTSRHVSALSLAQSVGGTPVPLISNAKWEPFGPVSGWDWHMASGLVNHTRLFDLSGRIVRYPLGNVLRDVTYDAADRINGFTHLSPSDGTPQPALDQSFGYDENSRLTGITTNSASWAIAYDPNGNRTSMSLNGSPSAYTTEATSNRLTSITNPARSFGYDNAGNTTSDSAGYTATYGLNGSIASITKAGVTGSYDYDAARRRIRKVTSSGETTIFVYDLEGQLLGEYDQTGKAIREYVWLDSIPVAMFMPDPSNVSGPPLIYYIHADHLNAPRVVVDQNGAKRWRWIAEPFGTTAPETNPDGLGAFTQNLRFPGQYADAESGLWYNHFRFYASDGGAYRQSDPVGLAGGINTFAYVEGNPLLLIDPNGLWAWGDPLPQWLVDGAAGFGDTLSFNGTSLIRQLADIGSVEKCSSAYGVGTNGAVLFSLAWGGAHLGRHAANVGAKRFFSDPRRYDTVQKQWSSSVGGYKGSYELHHWFTPQSAGGTSAGWNLVPVTPWLNNFMSNGGWAFSAFKSAFIGTYGAAIGAIPTAIMNSNNCECSRK